MAFTIAEYCMYIPLAKEKFLELPELNQYLIDSMNYNFRGLILKSPITDITLTTFGNHSFLSDNELVSYVFSSLIE